MKFTALWILSNFLLTWKGFDDVSASKLLATFPTIVRPGLPLFVNCHLLGRASQNLTLALVKDGIPVAKNTSTVPFGRQHKMMLNVPADLTSSKNFKVKISYSGDSVVSPIQYDDRKSLIFIQTDRGMYSKNEEVKMRLVTLTPALKPYKGYINATVYDGKNKLVRQWLNVRGTLGVFSRKFSIPSDPNTGEWRIVVEDMKTNTKKTFLVRKYVVPKYKVEISCPKFYTRSTRTLHCIVKARYTFGKKNEVNGVVHAQIVTKTTEGDKFLYDHHADIRGEFPITTPKNSSINFENDIEVLARVSDPSTGTTVVNSALIQLKQNAKMMWSLEPKRKFFQPGLKFVTFIMFQNLKNSSMLVSVQITKKKIKTCRGVHKYVHMSSEMRSNYIQVDSSGIGKLELHVGLYVTKLRIMTHDKADKHEKSLLEATRNRGLAIVPEQPIGVVGKLLNFQIVTKFKVKGPLWYSISSRDIVISGGQCSDNFRLRSSFKCSIKIEPNFYPGFHLLFYHVKSDGAIMADSVYITVRGNPTRRILSISKDKNGSYTPGATVQLTLKSPRYSVIHIMAIDEAVQKSQSGFDITISDIKSLLSRLESPREEKFENINIEGGKISTKIDLSIFPTKCTDPCSSSPCSKNEKCRAKSDVSFTCLSRNPTFSTYEHSYNKGKDLMELMYFDQGISGVKGKIHDFNQVFEKQTITQVKPCQSCKDRTQPSKSSGVVPGSTRKFSHGSSLSSIERIGNAEVKRLYFPRTWIWEDVYMSAQSSVTLNRTLPGTMTTWVLSAFSVDDANGLAILDDNENLKIPLFLPFFIELMNPSNIVAGNSARVKITLFNNTPIPKLVLVKIRFQSATDYRTSKVGNETSTLLIHGIQLAATRYGKFNISVTAHDIWTRELLDSIQKPVVVKAPGIQQMYNIPYFFTMSNRMSSVIKNVRITLPHHAIQGTQSVYLTVTGDIMAPTIGGLGHLIRTPCGCGEQTMMYLAPNVYVIHYLKSTNQLLADVRTKIVTNINRGIDNELRWQRSDGSFSVWGNRDRHGSTWLTSFVLLCFHQADSFVPVDKDIFTRGINWLLKKQNVDGSFQKYGNVIHYQMQGGVVASHATITAYVLLTLLENKDIEKYRKKMAIAKRKAVQYLTRSSVMRDLQNSNHGMAFTSYVLQKAGYQRKARQLYATLKRRSKISGEYMFWQDNGSKVYKQKLSWQAPNPRARPIDIETSAYALLYLSERRDITDGMKIMKWLVSQRNPQGGFTSTQDTVVSLHALSRFSCMLQQSILNAQVKVKSDSTEKTFNATQQNKQLIQRMELDNNTSNVEIKTSGKGLVLVDTVVKYNVMKSEDSAFEITTSIKSSKQTFDKITVNVCIRRKDNKDNGMVVAEVGVPCGFVGDLTKTRALNLEHKETSSDAVVLYFKNLRGSKVCFDVTAGRVDKVTESQAIPITVYDYYEPANYGITSYRSGKLEEMNLCNVCKQCSICQGIVLG